MVPTLFLKFYLHSGELSSKPVSVLWIPLFCHIKFDAMVMRNRIFFCDTDFKGCWEEI
jgi:hypothetical protein